MDYKFRLQSLQEYVIENKLEAFLVLTRVNRQYLSGFTGSAGAVLVSKTGGKLFVDERYLIRAGRETRLAVKNIKILPDSLRFISRRTGRVGIEDRISLRELKWLKKMGGKYAVTRDVVENLRAVKDGLEIRAVKKAQKILDRTFWHLKNYVRTGLTETAIALELERYAKKMGAEGLAFDSIVAFGPNAAAPHHLSSKQKIHKNNFLILDFGVLLGGYHSDFTRTLFLGRPNKKQEKVYNAVLEAQRRGVAGVQAGLRAAQVDAAAREYLASLRFGKYFTHNTGHGVGLQIHELPNFSPDSEDILRPGMVVTVEPGIYIEKWGGVRIEDLVVIENGPNVLSKIPKDFKSMIIK